ncbi:MAG: Cache domain-containing protein [uncultured Thiotrichaceae bacterium]|uniref:Cache domain-containing protein n=1 Tax=uncultured Thiotrichaceae bacterium TaxID=298394 RepID=A0A6S6TVG3_9GAMM|nr:MAG: Cache domain-containing protein [uncultured Thiotrichaceae bacterium]
MKFAKTVLTTSLLAFSMTAFAADEMATPEEAQAMSEAAAVLVNEKGDAAAFEEFSKEGGDFLKKDLYVFCMDLEGKMLSHAKKPALVGKNLLDYDKYGDKLFVDMIEVAKNEEGKGWVDYKWPRPGSEEITEKTSYVMKNEKDFFCGVGAYKPEEKAAESK